MAPTKRSSGRKPIPQKTTNRIIGGRTRQQREERPVRDARLLDAVNGVVSPSKVRSGQSLKQGEWDSTDPKLIHPCSICGRKFDRRDHVKVHMAPCVKRNGNPNGAHWDDAWKNIQDNGDDDDDEDIETSRDSQESESRGQTDERDLPDFSLDPPPPNDSITGNSPADLSSASSSRSSPSSSPAPLVSSPVPQSSSLALPSSSPVIPSLRSSSPDLHPHDTEDPTPSPQPHDNRAVGALAGYDPSVHFDHLTNEALIGMVYHLDYISFHLHQGQRNMGPHPQLEKVMKELEVRGMAREHHAWTLDIEGGAMEFDMVERGRPGS